MNNIPKAKVGIVAVSRDCFPESLSVNRRKALVAAYEGKYIKLASDLVNDRAKFMNSNRLAIQAAYPKFIDYLEEKGLTVEEINYVCLYAIGLIGKEVGRYIDRTGHFNTSSVIRHKLGLSIHETNIARYIRSLLKRFSK